MFNIPGGESGRLHRKILFKVNLDLFRSMSSKILILSKHLIISEKLTFSTKHFLGTNFK